jgi:hypothetical protein
MSSDDDSMIRKNIEVFERIQLASKMETRRIPSLLKNETSELLWAVAIKTEIERIRDFMGALAPETKAELFGKANPVWPCSIIHQNILLKTETILACEKLPTLTEDDESKDAWWDLLEIIFEIATDGKWEEVQELKSTYKSTAENTGTPAYERNYIRSSIKTNLKHKFWTRLAPGAK